MARSRPADPTRLSDVDLVAACRRGEHLAWRELVNRYRRLVYGIPRTLGLQPADADEVFQQAFVELLRHLPSFRQPDRVEAWLVTTTWRASLRLRGAARRRAWVPIESVEPIATDPPVGESLDRLREAESTRRVLDSLGEPCRSLLIGLFSDRVRPYRVLAAELGIAVGSIGAMRARCLARLRRHFRRERKVASQVGVKS